MLPRCGSWVGSVTERCVRRAVRLRRHGAHSQNPNALWDIVHGQCVPDQTAAWRSKAVCGSKSDARRRRRICRFKGYPRRHAVPAHPDGTLRRHRKRLASVAWRPSITLPTLGLRAVLSEKRSAVRCRATALSLAINSNSRARRTSCISISTAFAPMSATCCVRERDRIGRHWAPLGVAARRASLSRTCASPERRSPDMIRSRSWPHGVPGARADMGHYTLVVAGMTFADHKPGFVILADRADPAHGDSGRRRGTAGSRLRAGASSAVMQPVFDP